MGVLYAVTSLAGLLCFHALARRLVRRQDAALALTLLLCVAPETILYENKLYYEGLVAWWLVIGFYGLYRCVQSGRPAGGLMAFGFFSLVVLTRSAFHPGWIFGLAVLVVLLIKRRLPATMAAVCLPLLLVGAVIVKNVWMFGTTSLSSWGGINLAKMSIGSLAHEAREKMVTEGLLSALSSVEPFSIPETYLLIVGPRESMGAVAVDAFTKASGHRNLNRGVYVPVGKAMTLDALAAVEAYAQASWSRLAALVFDLNRSRSVFKGLANNLLPFEQYDRAFSLLVRGQPAALLGTALDAGPPQQPLAQVGIWSGLAWRGDGGHRNRCVVGRPLVSSHAHPSDGWFAGVHAG